MQLKLFFECKPRFFIRPRGDAPPAPAAWEVLGVYYDVAVMGHTNYNAGKISLTSNFDWTLIRNRHSANHA